MHHLRSPNLSSVFPVNSAKPNIVDRPVIGVAEIEDHTHLSAAEILGHLSFRAILGFGAPSAFLLCERRLGLQRIASPRAPMRMLVDSPQTHLRIHGGRISSGTISRNGPFWTLPVGVRGRASSSRRNSGSLYVAILFLRACLQSFSFEGFDCRYVYVCGDRHGIRSGFM
jgi:hypothetical protein